MTPLRFLFAGLRHHARTHFGVLLGVAVTSAVFVGALTVGDSVRHTLRRQADARIGEIDALLVGGDRFVRDAIADELAADDAVERSAPLVMLPTVASTPRGDRRVLDGRVLGVDGRFFALAPNAGDLASPAAKETYLSTSLAARLDASVGDTVILRVEEPSSIPRDLALSPDDSTAALRVKVARVVTDEEFASFALDASPQPSPNAFVDLGWLQERLGIDGTCNLVTLDLAKDADAFDRATARLDAAWQLTDAAVAVETLSSGEREIVSRRIFLDEPIVRALDGLDAAPMTGTFTYFVDRFGQSRPVGDDVPRADAEIPYSMVSAIAPLGGASPRSDPLLALTAGLAPGEVRLGQWASDDFAKSGWSLVPSETPIEFEFHVVDASRKLVTKTRSFRFAGVAQDVAVGDDGASVALEGTAAGEELMPAFPGLADADSCREWEPGTPVDLEAIRDQDETYWDDYRGTPKAFVRLDDARELWASRFGALTSVRLDAQDEAAVLTALREAIDPRDVGLFLRDVRARATAAGNSPTDFGGLFLGLSFFLIIAGLLLTTQLFLFGVEAREEELGVLASMGFPAARIRRWVAAETGLVAAAGAALGVPLGIGYTRLVLGALETRWADAVARQTIEFDARPVSLALGGGIAFAATMIAVFFGLRRALDRPVRSLLFRRQGVEAEPKPASLKRALGIAAGLSAVAVGIGVSVDPAGGPASSGAFFAAGGLLLIAGLLVVRALLRRGDEGQPIGGLPALGWTGATRRYGRSLGTVALMAIGTFLVLSVGVNRLGGPADPWARDAGTGGFAFYGRTNLPLTQDLLSEQGMDQFALEPEDLEGVSFVRMRTRDGDEASCLNLAKPTAPRLLGVDAAQFSDRGAFPFAKTIEDTDAPWSLLGKRFEDGAIGGIGDVTSLTWQLKLGIGDDVSYVDERGRPFTVRIVAALADTVLQGDLIIAEGEFERLFPSQGGTRRMLVDVAPERADAVRATLTESLSDVGLELESTGDRLDRFHAVQNTYLSIFQLLGALGLLVGSVGLGLVVLRNTRERRGELALLSAVGFSRGRVRRLVLHEYGALLMIGLAVGAVASLLAIVPLLISPDTTGALGRAGGLAGVIALNGLVWIVLSVTLVTGGSPHDGLRET